MQQGIASADLTKERGASLAALVDLELEEREADLKGALDAFEQQVHRWSRAGRFVVADTSFYIQHPQKLEELNLGSVVKVWGDEPVHLLFPMVVIDELDNLKQQGKNHTRWRAQYTLAVIDRLLNSPNDIGVLRERDAHATDDEGRQISPVTVEVVFDPPSHRRLPINDDEIVDRAVAIEALAGRQITLITYDTGQATRARQAGLNVVKLQQKLEPNEPPRT